MISIIEQLLNYEGIPFKRITDTKELMQLTKGRMNPQRVCGIKPYYGEEIILFDIYQTVEWINKNGLRRMG